MNGVRRGWMLPAVLVAMTAGWANTSVAQIATTTVQDTVYSADGTLATGTVLVSWNAFTTAGGESVAAGSASATIGAAGVLTMMLAPNAGSTPMGSYYTAVFHLGDGTTSREYWVVPVMVPGGGPATLAAIKNEVLPASVAMQTVSKQYVDTAIAAAQTGFPLVSSPYVLKAGDTMTGPLVLPADPVNTNQAADKHYVDTNVASVAAGLGQKVSLLPSATQIVAQPSGTQLDVNLLNGDLYASQFATGSGGNGIANALSSPDCATGCKLIVEPTYQGGDAVVVSQFGTNPVGTVAVDQRGGSQVQTVVNPLALGLSTSDAQSIGQIETLSRPQLEVLRPGTPSFAAKTLALSMQAFTGGSNQIPSSIVEAAPYGKSTYGTLAMTGTYDTQGQHVQVGNSVYCHGVGDCLAGGQYIYSSGGYRDAADEGTHPFDLFVSEDTAVFVGSCATGCSTGATSLKVTATGGAGTQGDGRFLIDTNPAKVITTGTLTGGGKTIYGTASFTGTSFPVSVFLSTAQAATSQAANIAPGTVTLAVATSSVPTGFATSTAALPSSSGVACVADAEGAVPIPNYEMANYVVIDGTHIQLTLNKVHAVGSTIAAGGLCGYGLEQTVDTTGGIRQLFPVLGSIDATDLYYADAMSASIGRLGGATSPSGYVNVALPVAAIARNANVVTVTTAGSEPGDLNGLSLTVSGVADSSYNGTFAVTTTGANTLTYASTGANSTSSGGTVTLLTGGYALYPMAEVLSVYDAANGQVDGTMALAANTVAWAAGDAVEEPHYYQQRTFADTEYVTQYVPRPSQYVSAGKTYQGTVGPGVRGWQVTNGAPTNQYFGAGGTHSLPDYAYVVAGPWNRDFDVQAGNQAVIWAHCNLNGCNRWDSTYNLFTLDSAAGYGADALSYSPQSSVATWRLGGVQYSFSPTSFTAGTINVGTLNATTITGGVSGAAITSGTVSAARLPLFGPSGSTHAPGIVPDPGATAGATRYLREDGSWNVPAGGGGGSGTVTNFAGGTWPSWLTPTITNATTTPSLAVVASAIPNTALANSATTVNGQSCALGSSCTITVGSSAYSSLTSGTNTTAAMTVGTGASLSASGTGTIAATSVPFTGVIGTASVAQLPTGIPNTNLANAATTVNGQSCALGGTCSITAAPPTDIKYYPAAVCDGGTAYASGVTRYDNQQPQAGCLLPASSTAAYLAFNAVATLPQYASATIATPTYWTGTSLYLKFAGTATTGNVGWIVDTACTNDGSVISTATFGTATTITTTVSSTLGANVTTAVFSSAGVPGTNGCTAGTTTPGSLLTYRIHRSATDTQAGNANLLGVVLVTGRSQ
jgi:trimeric autotransporter adhesin